MTQVLTKAALALRVKPDVEVVKFESFKPKKKLPDDGTRVSSRAVEHPHKKDLDLKKIRHEIVKFGTSGFDSTKKEEAQIALAVSLGAKPPKKEYLNYKELMKKRKEEKKKENEEKQLDITKARLHSSGKPQKRKADDVGHLLGSYGKVKKNEIQKEDGKANKRKKKSK